MNIFTCILLILVVKLTVPKGLESGTRWILRTDCPRGQKRADPVLAETQIKALKGKMVLRSMLVG